MFHRPTDICAVCGSYRHKHDDWFLVAQEHLGTSLRISFWSQANAAGDDVWACCSVRHVQHFAQAWLATIDASSSITGYPGGRAGFALTAQQKVQLHHVLTEKRPIDRTTASTTLGNRDASENELSIQDALNLVFESFGPDTEAETASDSEDVRTFDC